MSAPETFSAYRNQSNGYLAVPRTCMLRNFFVYILLLLRHVSRLAKMLGQNVDLYPCRGILIDGDHAIDWRKDGIAQSQER